MDKTLILNKLQTHYNFKKDADFAQYLGVSGQLLSKWSNMLPTLTVFKIHEAKHQSQEYYVTKITSI